MVSYTRWTYGRCSNLANTVLFSSQSHTILLVQPHARRPETRTYSDFESINEALEGVCRIYEEHLKRYVSKTFCSCCLAEIREITSCLGLNNKDGNVSEHLTFDETVAVLFAYWWFLCASHCPLRTSCMCNWCRLNPNQSQITYDIAQLFAFIDQLADLTCLVYQPATSSYAPHNKDWIKEKIYVMLRTQVAR